MWNKKCVYFGSSVYFNDMKMRSSQIQLSSFFKRSYLGFVYNFTITTITIREVIYISITSHNNASFQTSGSFIMGHLEEGGSRLTQERADPSS